MNLTQKKKIKTFEEIREELKKRLNQSDIRVDNLIYVLKCVLEVVELTKVEGPEKKRLAMVLLDELINESNMISSDKKKYTQLIKDGILQDTIDLIVSASKHKIKINKKKIIKTGIIKRVSRSLNSKARLLQMRTGSSRRKSKERRSI